VVGGGRATAGEAQARFDVRPQAIMLAAPEPFVGLGAGVARWGRFRTALGVNATGGLWDGAAAGRVELWAGYHLNPVRTSGWGAYGGAGGAFAARDGDVRGFLTVFLGAEHRPARARGWFLELGVGGGPRVVLGYRVRHGGGI